MGNSISFFNFEVLIHCQARRFVHRLSIKRILQNCAQYFKTAEDALTIARVCHACLHIVEALFNFRQINQMLSLVVVRVSRTILTHYTSSLHTRLHSNSTLIRTILHKTLMLYRSLPTSVNSFGLCILIRLCCSCSCRDNLHESGA